MEENIFDSDFFKKLYNMSLNTRIAMSEGMAGARKSRAKGSSVEFSDFREYSSGDDFRRIDWNTYGRFDKLFVKLFMEEREALVNILIDSSRSMKFGEKQKSDMALKLAAVFSFLALNNLDRVCINSVKENSIKQFPVAMGRLMFNNCINNLRNIDFLGNCDLVSTIKRKEFYSRGISIILSDLFVSGNIEEAIKYLLYKKQEVIIIHILSEEELNPMLNGQVKLIDSETNINKNVTITPSIMKRYNKHLNEFISSVESKCKRLGAAYIQVSSSEEIEKIVFKYLIKIGAVTY